MCMCVWSQRITILNSFLPLHSLQELKAGHWHGGNCFLSPSHLANALAKFLVISIFLWKSLVHKEISVLFSCHLSFSVPIINVHCTVLLHTHTNDEPTFAPIVSQVQQFTTEHVIVTVHAWLLKHLSISYLQAFTFQQCCFWKGIAHSLSDWSLSSSHMCWDLINVFFFSGIQESWWTSISSPIPLLKRPCF